LNNSSASLCLSQFFLHAAETFLRGGIIRHFPKSAVPSAFASRPGQCIKDFPADRFGSFNAKTQGRGEFQLFQPRERGLAADNGWCHLIVMSNELLLSRITIEPGKCGGRPCIRGMRMRVSDVLELLSAGASYEEILKDYPDLERDDILAAIEYAAHQTDHVVLQTA
jgi:uncharacterized protein (DUF433 family)